MSDSTTDTKPGEGAFDVGSSVDDLFGNIETEAESSDEREGTTDADPAEDIEEREAAEERTAADVFERLQDDVGTGSADNILADESPDDIIASADEPDPAPDDAVDEELLADDDELADLLLTGRSTDGDGEFRWIDPDDSTARGEGESETASDEMLDWGSEPDADGMLEDENTELGPDAPADRTAETASGQVSDVDPDAAIVAGSDVTTDTDDGAIESDADEDEAPEVDDGAGSNPADDSAGLLSRLRSALGRLF